MAERRVVILGAKGMLGSDLVIACQNHGLATNILDLPEFDITNEKQLKEAVTGANAIINCAAYTNVDRAESEPDLAYKVNAQAVGKLGSIAKDHSIWVLHISTDFVFDGKLDKTYVETDPPAPINTYGKTKLAGEQLLVESRCPHCIIRIQWTYGKNGSNFITKLISLAKHGKVLKVVDDQIGSPTATTEIAKVICDFVKKKPQGLFHFASTGYISRFEMAQFIFDKVGLPVNLTSCKTSDYKSAAARPLNSRFDCSKIQSLLDEPIEPWEGPLERFVRQL